MCGIIAVLLADASAHVNQMLFDGLTMLQHRGQDAAGMVTYERGQLRLRKDNGLVAEVFQTQHMLQLRGNVGLAHCRYPTAGSASSAEAQPLYTNYPFGICIAHNGNLTNTTELQAELEAKRRHINTTSDSEVLLNVFAEELQRHCASLPTPDEVFSAVEALMRRCRGGYAVALLIHGVGVLCFRDPWGIRPLCYGTRASPHGVDFACASESVALDSLRFEMEGDVQSGEAILATLDGGIHKRMCHESAIRAPCIFEYVYFARPDTILDGVSVYESRLRMGEHLADKILRLRPDHDIDVVIPIPDTSRTSALECARVLQRPFREGFIKNRYIARTFIMPGQETRKKSVRLKLNTIKAEFQGKRVLLVDDSIVRGTTSRELVLMAREAGATKVYFVSAAPAVRFPNVYGIDIPTRSELVAYGREDDEVAAAIGADWVVYQDLDALEDSVRHFNPELKTFDASCFNGKYITGDIDEAYFSTSARSQARATEERIPSGVDVGRTQPTLITSGDTSCTGLQSMS